LPLVSIIIPSYNHERFVGEAIRSALDQTLTDIEVIVVDDASSDRSPQVIRSFSDARVQCVIQPQNLGISAAINKGISLANAPYVAVMGSDDVFLPEKLETQVAILDNRPDVAVAFSDIHLIDGDGQIYPQREATPASQFTILNRSRRQWLAHMFQSGNCFCHPSSVMRKACLEQVGGYDERLLQLQDFEMWLRVLMRWDIHVCDKKLVKYRWQRGTQNLSAPDLDRMARLRWETPHVLTAFLQLTFDDLREMFGADHVARYQGRGLPAQMVIIDMALASPSPEYQLFGLDSLFSLLPASGASNGLYPYLSIKALELDPLRFKSLALSRQGNAGVAF
jgi:glycosyltransferase involved in cell wall biosynthesis